MSRRHEYSQHFLRSPRIVATLVGHSNLKKSDTVLDIGAGSGVITSTLAQRVQHVIAVEAEAAAVAKLRSNISDLQNVTVVQGDFLSFDLPHEDYKVFANIPFSLSAKILDKLLHAENLPSAVYLIVQKQFANKLLPDHDGFSSQVGMIIGFSWKVRIRYRLRKDDFTPPPAVDTVLLELLPREKPLVESKDSKGYEAFIRNNFTDQNTFAAHGFAKGTKPSSLKLSDWIRLFNETEL